MINHQQQCYQYFHHVCTLFVDVLAPKYVSPIILYSEEYFVKLSQKAFHHFMRLLLYSVDIIKVCIFLFFFF